MSVWHILAESKGLLHHYMNRREHPWIKQAKSLSHSTANAHRIKCKITMMRGEEFKLQWQLLMF